MEPIIGVPLAIAFVIAVVWLMRPSERDLAKWHTFDTWRWRRAIDGARIRGDIMRRKVGGVWQYRLMTDDETVELDQGRAW